MGEDIVDKVLLEGKYDESNPFVLTLKKAKTKQKHSAAPTPKILSRSKRKLLQKQLSKKEKKINRNDLWKELEAFRTQDATNLVVNKAFRFKAKATKHEKKVASSLKSTKWRRHSSSSSDSSVDTDQFSSMDELDEPIQCSGTPEQDKPSTGPPASVYELNETPTDGKCLDSGRDLGMKKKFVLVNREPEIQEARMALPIVAEEASIMEKISDHDVVILCGATGCGKTTQLPQFLYEAGYTLDGYKIGITEPRRVAAISMSERVSTELGLANGEVGYHIRYENKISPRTEIKFMTDGILLQEMKKDFQLSSYSAIVIDEAHERSLYTDVLLGLLSLVTRMRRRLFNENPETARLPLKLIIMSATLRVDDFADNKQLFPTIKDEFSAGNKRTQSEDDENEDCSRLGAPPVLKIESRQFPVTCHFARHTPEDYMKAAFRKAPLKSVWVGAGRFAVETGDYFEMDISVEVASIHTEAPTSGGILVFLTGQREVKTFCNWLTEAFPVGADTKTDVADEESVGARQSTDPSKPKRRKRRRTGNNQDTQKSTAEEPPSKKTTSEDFVQSMETPAPRINLDNFDIIPADEEAELGLGNDDRGKALQSAETGARLDAADDDDWEGGDLAEDIRYELKLANREKPAAPILALPLYSLLPPEQQRRVFNAPPDGHRLVIVSTNVAETSLTIPNIRYVVDTGKVKSKIYDTATGASCFRVVWVCRASSEQRAGRAGRVGPGHCYRLYSSHVFADEMVAFSPPDILTRPIDEVVLLLKSYLGSMALSRFPLPTPPSPLSVEAAERRLLALGALEEKKTGQGALRTITREGRWMARLPLPVRFARMLLFANQHGLMPYAVALIAALSVPDFFLLDQSTPSAELEETGAKAGAVAVEKAGGKRGDGNYSEAEKRAKFVRQFVNTEGDLMLGDLAVLLGVVCCLERYWAQLIGTLEPSESPTEGSSAGIFDRVARLNPDATMRRLTQQCGVRWKAFLEVRQLRRQITDILNANVQDLNLTVHPALPKPTPTQVEELRQLFLVGSTCHLAAKFDLPTEGLPAKDRRRLRYAYKVPGVSGPVFIDSTSPIARENYSFIAYTELHKSSKPFLRNVCAVNPAWIPFLAPRSYRVEGLNVAEAPVDTVTKEADKVVKSDEPTTSSTTTVPTHLATPAAPYYDPEHDCVMAYAKRAYFVGADLVLSNAPAASGDAASSIELPAAHTPVPLSSDNSAACAALGDHEISVWSVRWFARALLEGKVYPKELGAWFPNCVKPSTPTRMITLSWGLVRPEVRNLISKMLSKKISSKRDLEACLMEDSGFLAKELTAWLPTDCHANFALKWPPIKSQRR